MVHDQQSSETTWPTKIALLCHLGSDLKLTPDSAHPTLSLDNQ